MHREWNKELNKENGVPLHRQLVEALRQGVRSGELGRHARIPGMGELSERFGVNRVAVGSAIEQLVAERVLVKRPGRGIFAEETLETAPLEPMPGFSQACRDAGQHPSAKPLEAKIAPLTGTYAKLLDRPRMSYGIYLDRLRCLDGQPALVERCIFPLEYGFVLERDMDGSLFDALREQGIDPAHKRSRVTVRGATEEEAALLEIPIGEALLQEELLVQDAALHPIYFVSQAIRSDRYWITYQM